MFRRSLPSGLIRGAAGSLAALRAVAAGRQEHAPTKKPGSSGGLAGCQAHVARLVAADHAQARRGAAVVQAAIEREIVLRHAARREALVEPPAQPAAIAVGQALQRA